VNLIIPLPRPESWIGPWDPQIVDMKTHIAICHWEFEDLIKDLMRSEIHRNSPRVAWRMKPMLFSESLSLQRLPEMGTDGSLHSKSRLEVKWSRIHGWGNVWDRRTEYLKEGEEDLPPLP
jgi:hypothetical protein